MQKKLKVTMSATKVIDWEKTLDQVQGDESFLNEVLGDLLTEAKDAQNEIGEGISSANWSMVSKAAHRVKGSSAYLYCEQMRVCSLNLQDLGQNALTAPPEKIEEIVKGIQAWYGDYCESVARVEAEVATRYGQGGGK